MMDLSIVLLIIDDANTLAWRSSDNDVYTIIAACFPYFDFLIYALLYTRCCNIANDVPGFKLTFFVFLCTSIRRDIISLVATQ